MNALIEAAQAHWAADKRELALDLFAEALRQVEDPHLLVGRIAALLADQADADGRWAALVAAFQDQAAVLMAMAFVLGQRPTTDLALACLERYVVLRPLDPDGHFRLGSLQAARFNLVPALQSLREAMRLRPNATTLSLLGWVATELGEEEFFATLARAPTVRDAIETRLRFELHLPQIYLDSSDLQARRESYAAAIAQLHAEPPQFGDPRQVFALNQSNFLLAYQGCDDLALQTAYAEMLQAWLRRARPDLLSSVAPKESRDGRIRVGFASGFFFECTIGRYFGPWIEALPRDRFDLSLIHFGSVSDGFSARLEACADRVVRGGRDVEALADTIRALDLDVLIYPELGMHATGMLLANLRLAPLQCAAWGHPVTTGSAQIDYFLSCGAMEPAGAANHYRESLGLLPGIGTAYSRPAPAADLSFRQRIGLGEDRHVFLCPHSLFKIHPDNDAIYLDLLERDERAVLLFFQGTSSRKTAERFLARLQRGVMARGLPPRGQIKLLPRLNPNQFRAALAAGDVVLDALHWSGGNTSLDVLAMGTPLITQRGEFMRGRQSAAMLDAIGLPELIAGSNSTMVAQAIALAADRDFNTAMRRRIAKRMPALFGQQAPLEALRRFLREIHEARLDRASGH